MAGSVGDRIESWTLAQMFQQGGRCSMQFWRKPLDADTIEVPWGEIHILVEQCKGVWLLRGVLSA